MIIFKYQDCMTISDGFSLLPMKQFLSENHFEINLLAETITDK